LRKGPSRIPPTISSQGRLGALLSRARCWCCRWRRAGPNAEEDPLSGESADELREFSRQAQRNEETQRGQHRFQLVETPPRGISEDFTLGEQPRDREGVVAAFAQQFAEMRLSRNFLRFQIPFFLVLFRVSAGWIRQVVQRQSLAANSCCIRRLSLRRS
jgi:hypothetical protein